MGADSAENDSEPLLEGSWLTLVAADEAAFRAGAWGGLIVGPANMTATAANVALAMVADHGLECPVFDAIRAADGRLVCWSGGIHGW